MFWAAYRSSRLWFCRTWTLTLCSLQSVFASRWLPWAYIVTRWSGSGSEAYLGGQPASSVLWHCFEVIWPVKIVPEVTIMYRMGRLPIHKYCVWSCWFTDARLTSFSTLCHCMYNSYKVIIVQCMFDTADWVQLSLSWWVTGQIDLWKFVVSLPGIVVTARRVSVATLIHRHTVMLSMDELLAVLIPSRYCQQQIYSTLSHLTDN